MLERDLGSLGQRLPFHRRDSKHRAHEAVVLFVRCSMAFQRTLRLRDDTEILDRGQQSGGWRLQGNAASN